MNILTIRARQKIISILVFFSCLASNYSSNSLQALELQAIPGELEVGSRIQQSNNFVDQLETIQRVNLKSRVDSHIVHIEIKAGKHNTQGQLIEQLQETTSIHHKMKYLFLLTTY